MREFETAAGRAGVIVDKEITFMLDDREMTAHSPTAGQLALFMRSDGGRMVPSMMGFLADVLAMDDWRYVERRLHQGIEIGVLVEICNYLIGEWSGRPTKPPSDSSDTPTDTGPRSTEKELSTASTF